MQALSHKNSGVGLVDHDVGSNEGTRIQLTQIFIFCKGVVKVQYFKSASRCGITCATFYVLSDLIHSCDILYKDHTATYSLAECFCQDGQSSYAGSFLIGT